MSGIFGFSIRNANADEIEETLGGLEYWNRLYGCQATDQQVIGHCAMGCHVEHFSDKFPWGGPILHFGRGNAVVDALLYNRDELLPMVNLPADSLISDEELLLKLCSEKGFDALTLVNGDFAGAIFDPDKEEWTLFRDHLGVRPLYFYRDRDRFVFATDLRGIVAAPGVDARFNGIYLYKSIVGGNSLSVRDTNFQHIRCVLPGSVCRFRMEEREFSERESVYWRIHRKKIRLGSDEAYRNELRRLVTDAVNRRCDAFPGLLGAELSGGLDSGVIDILVNRHGRDAVYYSWSTDPARFPLRQGEDERKVILDICEQEQIECKYLGIEERFNFQYTLDHVMPPFVNTVQLSYGSKWMSSQGAQCVFTGHGGDEGVSHRCSRFELLYNGELWSYFKLYWNDTKGVKLRLLRTIWRCYNDARAKWKKLNYEMKRERLYPSFFDERYCDAMVKEFQFRPLPFSFAPHHYIMQGGTRARLDNGAYQGARYGVRYLFPYVDYRVMDFAVSIPRRQHINQETNRLIFREAFADLMPESLRTIRYKDMASIRTENIAPRMNDSIARQVDYMIGQLDPECWDGVLKLEGLRELSRDPNLSRQEAGQILGVLAKLERFVLVQNTQKQAKHWREFRDADRIL